MTKATSETTKLNFITDQGSIRAMVRCACLAERFDCPFFCGFCGAIRIVTGPSPASVLSGLVLPGLVLPGLADEAAWGAAEPFPVVPDRRNVRAGDDGELGGGSGISHANAAGDTDGGSADVGGAPDEGRPKARHPTAPC